MNGRNLIIALLLLLTSCVGAEMHQYGDIDPTDKSITVPAGGEEVIASLKDALKQNGFRVLVAGAKHVIRGENGKVVNLEEFNTLKTRYQLSFHAFRYDTCLGHMDGAYNYDLSVIDLVSGEEIMAMGGKACESQILEKFHQFLGS